MGALILTGSKSVLSEPAESAALGHEKYGLRYGSDMLN